VYLIALNIIISVSIQGQIPYDSFAGDDDYDDYYDDYDDDDGDSYGGTIEDENTVVIGDDNITIKPNSSSTTTVEKHDVNYNNITVSDSVYMTTNIYTNGNTISTYPMDIINKTNLENSTIIKVDDMIVIANSSSDTQNIKINPWIIEDINNLQNRRIIVNNRMRGLQNGMDALVETLKIISDQLVCGHKELCSPPFKKVSSGECLYVNLDNRKSWAFAREYCQSLGADLAEPGTISQDLGYMTRLSRYDMGRDRLWMGASDRNVEGIWRWVSGRRVAQDIGWPINQPRDITGKEDCMAIVIKHPPTVESASCFRRKAFICQKHN